MTAFAPPTPQTDIQPTPHAEMDYALQTLYTNKEAWVQTTTTERLVILDELRATLQTVLAQWVQASQAAKHIPEGDPGRGDDFVFATIAVRQITLLRQSLQDIEKYGRPQLPGDIYCRDDGRVVAEVFPKGTKDSILYNGVRGKIWFNPGHSVADVLNAQARNYRTKGHRGKVALVLGAGNVSGLVPGDFMYKLFAEDQVVIVKMNPVNEYLGPIMERGYAPLVARGFLRFVYGGVEEGSYLIDHEIVEELHITGADKTHDAIVFGPGETGKQRRRDRNPLVTKRFTSELGNITPVIIVPGPWTKSDIQLQAAHLAGQLTVNAGFNCLTPRVIVQQAGWDHREQFNAAFNAVLRNVPTRYAYYPGAAQRYTAFTEAHPEATQHGDACDGHLPWTYIQNVDPTNTDDIAFNTEAFCGLTTETALPAESPADFLDAAVDFVNATLWGTLVAEIIIHPESLKDPQTKAAYERAVANLRYGSVCVNVSSAFGYALMATSWGGHSGSNMFDVQSGTGVVNNLLLFDGGQIQKSVVTAPFRNLLASQNPSDPKFAGLAEGLMWFELDPSPRTMFGLVRRALRG